jgi:hypothetical protein
VLSWLKSINNYLTELCHFTLQKPSILLQEVGAAVPILLGFAPPSTLSASSSSKVLEIISDVQFLLPYLCFITLLL